MVEYAYRDLFYKTNQKKDVIIVDTDATVTPVANSAPTITGETYLYISSDIKASTFQLDESLCSEDNLRFGLCESSSISVTVKNKGYSSMKNVMVNVYLYFNGNSSTLFQIGVYKVEVDEYSADRRFRNLQMYDLLYELREFDISEWYYGSKDYQGYFANGASHTIEESIEDLFEYLDVVGDYPITLKDGQTLINGDYVIGATIESDTITFDFFVQRLLEINGVFGHINRQGEFEYVALEWYSAPPVRQITDDYRLPNSPYQDDATWGIGQIKVYNRDNINTFTFRNTTKKRPSTYNIVDSFVFEGKPIDDPNTMEALQNFQGLIYHTNYRPYEVECSGDLCVEVGDRINTYSGDNRLYRSYVLERHMTGIANLLDTYSAKGDLKQPQYQVQPGRTQLGDSVISVTGTEGTVSVITNDFDNQLVEKVRNFGFRFLDEPSNAKCEYDDENHVVKLKWTDPIDLSQSEPVACTWAKTYVVRRENEPAMNIYQGDIIATVTTKDAYSSTWLEDNTVQPDKHYYYSIMPCDTKDDIRWTKCFSVNTYHFVDAPEITDVHMGAGIWDGSETDILWSGDSNKLTVEYYNSQIIFRLYTSNTVIYSWSALVYGQITVVDKIHVSFLKDDTNEVAKPSFIYETSTGVYAYNQESPSTSEMADIYTWLNPT